MHRARESATLCLDMNGHKPAVYPEGTVWRAATIVRRLDVHARTLDRMVKRGEFPQPIRIGIRIRGWRAVDVLAWIEARGER